MAKRLAFPKKKAAKSVTKKVTKKATRKVKKKKVVKQSLSTMTMPQVRRQVKRRLPALVNEVWKKEKRRNKFIYALHDRFRRWDINMWVQYDAEAGYDVDNGCLRIVEVGFRGQLMVSFFVVISGGKITELQF